MQWERSHVAQSGRESDGNDDQGAGSHPPPPIGIHVIAYYVPDDNIVQRLEITGGGPEPPQEIRVPNLRPVFVTPTGISDVDAEVCSSIAHLFRGITKEGVKFYFYARPDTSLDRFAMMCKLIKAQHLK